MEEGEGSHVSQNMSKSSSDSVSKPDAANSNNNGSDEQPPAPYVREQDKYMPIANVIRIMRRAIPSHVKISDDSKETVQECVSEFIGFVTSEANERCQSEQRKTITAEDLVWAMGRLGFDNYVGPLTVYLCRYREAEMERNFARGEPSVRRVVDFGGPVESYFPPFPVGAHVHEVFRYLRDGSGGSGGGSSSEANFDPFYK